MTEKRPPSVAPRRHFLLRAAGAAGALMLAGCNRLSQSEWFPKVLAVGEKASDAAAHVAVPRRSMAQEFAESDRSPTFRANGTSDPDSEAYRALAST